MKNDKWNVFEDLTRLLNIYSIFEYIYENHECIVSEIMKKTGISKSTLYDYINKALDIEIIAKEDNDGTNKKGAHFLVVARPRLKMFLRKFHEKIKEFSQNMSKYHDSF